MKAAMLVLALVLLAFAGVLACRDSNDIKAIAGMDDGIAAKSIMEDVAYWVWPAKWAQYQQERLDAQYERSLQQP